MVIPAIFTSGRVTDRLAKYYASILDSEGILTGKGLLNQSTLLGFLIWLVVLSLLILMLFGCFCYRKILERRMRSQYLQYGQFGIRGSYRRYNQKPLIADNKLIY
jgi:hypothetical protein